MSPRRRTVVVWCATLALLGLVVVVRVLVEGARELSAGQAALARSDFPEGIRRLRRAAHWYLPGGAYHARAYEALEHVAQQAEEQGRTEHALAAWRAIRGSALATRWLIVPERVRLARANRHIAALMAELPPPPEDRESSRTRLQEEHLALLSADHAPEPAWVLVMALGFALWLGGAVWATRNGWDENDRVRARALALSGAVVGSGLLLFVLGITQA